MKANIECPICSDIFGNDSDHIKAPKILKCGDNVCKECLEQIINNKEEEFFICPICKKNIKKEQNVDEYITNNVLFKAVNDNFNIPKNEINPEEKLTSYTVISLGNTNVGKTSIFKRLSENIFSENCKSTIGMDTYTYFIKYKNKKYILNLNDPPGSEKYRAITKNFLRNKDGVLFVFDISNKESFDDLESWYNLYKEENGDVVGVLIGNKCDCQREVEEKDAKKFAEDHDLRYFETSAKLDKMVKKVIAYLLEEIINYKIKNQDLASINESISLRRVQKRQKKDCKC